MGKLSVLLVDDNPQFLKAARDLVGALPGVAAIACAKSGAEALARARESRPDLVLTDIVMPDMSGFGLIRALRAGENPPRIVAVTLHEGAEYRAAAQRNGADALVSKREFGALIPELISSLAGGGVNVDATQIRAQPHAVFAAGGRDRRRQRVIAIKQDGSHA